MSDGMAEQNKVEENVYGGTEGRDAMYVKLISKDGFEFIIKSEYAFISRQLMAMAIGPFPITTLEVHVPFLSCVVERVCTYLTYKAYYSKSNSEVPEFPIPAEVVLDLLEAAMFLMC